MSAKFNAQAWRKISASRACSRGTILIFQQAGVDYRAGDELLHLDMLKSQDELVASRLCGIGINGLYAFIIDNAGRVIGVDGRYNQLYFCPRVSAWQLCESCATKRESHLALPGYFQYTSSRHFQMPRTSVAFLSTPPIQPL